MSLVACPWDGLTPANLRFCEADLCAWIVQPSNTWTNVGFLVAGAVILRDPRRGRTPMAGWLGPIAIVTALTSSALHATGTLAGQLVDQASMFLESALFIVLNLRRAGLPAGRSVYAALVLASTALLLLLPTGGIALFVAHVLAFLGLELALLLKRRGPAHYGFFLAAAGTFAVSYCCWWADQLRVACNPDNHVLSLHGVWHLLGAASFYLWFRHFA